MIAMSVTNDFSKKKAKYTLIQKLPKIDIY